VAETRRVLQHILGADGLELCDPVDPDDALFVSDSDDNAARVLAEVGKLHTSRSRPTIESERSRWSARHDGANTVVTLPISRSGVAMQRRRRSRDWRSGIATIIGST
jgi:hypothetical protein